METAPEGYKRASLTAWLEMARMPPWICSSRYCCWFTAHLEKPEMSRLPKVFAQHSRVVAEGATEAQDDRRSQSFETSGRVSAGSKTHAERGKACPHGWNWRGRHYGTIIVHTSGYASCRARFPARSHTSTRTVPTVCVSNSHQAPTETLPASPCSSAFPCSSEIVSHFLASRSFPWK